jgi:hypothetical protein
MSLAREAWGLCEASRGQSGALHRRQRVAGSPSLLHIALLYLQTEPARNCSELKCRASTISYCDGSLSVSSAFLLLGEPGALLGCCASSDSTKFPSVFANSVVGLTDFPSM